MTLEALANSATLNMVQGQLAPNGIRNEAVLEAFLSLDRAMYLPPFLQAFANIDDNIGDKDGHVMMMRPVALGLMLQYIADEIKTGKVAVIGDGSGYIVDLLTEIGFNPSSIHDEKQLQQNAPWDAILLNGCLSSAPDYLLPHVTENGAIMTIVRPEDSTIGDIKAIGKQGSVTLGQGSAPYIKSLTPPPLFAL